MELAHRAGLRLAHLQIDGALLQDKRVQTLRVAAETPGNRRSPRHAACIEIVMAQAQRSCAVHAAAEKSSAAAREL